MSVSGALSNALSGLTAAARAADVVSSNISNALTDGYGRRELQLSSRSVGLSGAGVQIDGINRAVDRALLTDRRSAQSQVAYSSVKTDFLGAIETRIGTPDQTSSLSAKFAGFEAALIQATSMPDSQPRLQAVLNTAVSISDHINAVSNEIQTQRMNADQLIGQQVAQVNDALQKIAELNHGILMATSSGRDPSALLDQRQQLTDQIAGIIPLKEVDRGNGQIALFTPGGAILLDGKAASISFQPVGIITPDMTLASAALSGLSLNGVPIDTARPNGPIGGGSLAALFEVRDALAPAAQERMDALSRDLIERFQDPNVDPTLLPGQAGIFSDFGAGFDPLQEGGLAGRLRVNPLIDPAAGGSLSRLRDGLGAGLPGDVGSATQLQALVQAFTAQRSPASGGFMGAARSASGLSIEILSLVAQEKQLANDDQAFSMARMDTLRTLELQNGVDSDYELQHLILIEQAYSANARMIQTVDDMIQTLLGI